MMESVKKNNLWKYAAFAMAFCLLLLSLLYPVVGRAAAENMAAAPGQAQSRERTINITGSADIMVAPDEVNITAGIETRNSDFRKAKSENDENAKKVIELTRKYGIASKHVQSDYIRTYPSYDYEKSNETNRISYYNVQKRIVIKLKDISKFEQLISDLTDSSAVMVQNIEFRSTKLAQYRNEARKLAARAARDKAELLASELGTGIGKVITINEEQVRNYTWYGSWWGHSWYGYGRHSKASNVAVNYNSHGGPGSGQEGGTISIGQIKITAKIAVVFGLD